MSVLAAEAVPAPSCGARRSTRRLAATRAAVAVLWAVAFLATLHGRRVATGSDVALGVGLLLAAYPLIDAAASLYERRAGLVRARPHAGPVRAGLVCAGLVLDGLAVVALFVATLTGPAGSLLITFGTWAFASGLLQLVNAGRGRHPRRGQLPLIISGGISMIAGISFAALAGHHTVTLAGLAGYAILGAIFFVLWTVLDARGSARTNTGEPGA